jgi:patatin-related protein
MPDVVRPSPLVSEGDPRVTELRLALVCFGGVSLAIYMHGITKEVHSLLRASRAFDAALANAGDGDPSPDALPDGGTERAYFAQLVELWRAGVPTTTTVDIITGTSAGGINGICLAQAAVCGSGQDSLTQLWMERGDIGGLMRYGFLGQHVGELATALVMPWKAGSDWSPLKGDDMCRWLYGALADMESAAATGTPMSLLPEGGTLDLFVTATDLHGTDQVLAVGAGGGLHDRTYHRVFEFHYEPHAAGAVSLAASRGGATINTIGKGHAWPLAFAARATSCFPGAFPPISLADFADAVAKLPANTGEYNPDRFAALFMPEYRLLPNGNPAKAYMMDGGVLDNAPFDHAIAAIASKPAGREVVRHLVFIEPDPGDASPGASVDHLAAADADQSAAGDKPPTWAAGVWAALSTIPHHQPLLNSVQRLADVNERVATIGRVTRELEDDVMAQLQQRGVTVPDRAAPMTFDELKATAKTVYDAVPALVGELNYRTYGRLKMQAIADRLARDLAANLTYPPTSSQAGFLRAAMVEWVHAQPAWSDPNSDVVQAWLGPLDLPYRERRLEFVIAGVNALFDEVTRAQVAKQVAGNAPSREQLAGLKQAAWTLLLDERAKPAVAISNLDAGVTAFAATAALGQAELLIEPAQWAADHGSQFAALVGAYKAEIGTLTADSAANLWSAFRQAVDGWDSGRAQTSIVGRFVGFPVWDALLFPVQSLSRLPLFNPIHATRFSPVDATALKSSTPTKLEGVATHHFGAFFTLERRQNDYLWGRLDGAELLLQLLRGQYTSRRPADGPPLPDQGAILSTAVGAVLDQEAAHLKEVPDRIAGLRAQLPLAL